MRHCSKSKTNKFEPVKTKQELSKLWLLTRVNLTCIGNTYEERHTLHRYVQCTIVHAFRKYNSTILSDCFRRMARKREIKIKIKRVGRRKGEKMGVRQRKGEGGRKKRNW